ncbi:hypothetical protein Tco_0333594 [Tanacetum coccineum]
MRQNPTDSHLEGKSPWRDSNLRHLAWSNNLLKVTLLDDASKPLAKVDSSGDHDSKDEVASVDNEMANFLASKNVGYGQDIPDKIQATCDNLDIKVRGRKKKYTIAKYDTKRQSLGLVDEEDNDVTYDVSGGGKKWHVRELSDDFHRVGTKKRVMEMEGEARFEGGKCFLKDGASVV